MCCTGPCGVENTNTEPGKLITGAEDFLLPNENIYGCSTKIIQVKQYHVIEKINTADVAFGR